MHAGIKVQYGVPADYTHMLRDNPTGIVATISEATLTEE